MNDQACAVNRDERTKTEPLWQFIKPMKPNEAMIPDYFPGYYLIAIDEHTFYIVTAVSGLGSRGQICRVYKIGLG